MYSLTILKPITEQSIEHLFPHSDDLENILEAIEDDTLEYIPHKFVVMLINAGFIE